MAMQIKLYNSLSKTIEEFIPINKDCISIYSCGPTVYNYVHIGNLRAFIFPDLLQKVLRNVADYKVDWVMNITDIDDKTIRDSKFGSENWDSKIGEQSQDNKANLAMLTNFYANEFLKDIDAIGIRSKDFKKMPRATEYIKEMQELINLISQNGYAYSAGASIYFNVSKWKDNDKYGKLKKIDFENFRSDERIDNDEYEKEEVSDFVLWKARKEDEPYWDFEFDGINHPGRPGWHLECSAMGKSILGLPFDIHTGGIDLKFPHHEDEIAQSKAGYGIEPVNYWCHNAFLEVEGSKMSKSLGNFYTLRDLTNKNINPIDIRFSMLAAHYRSTYNFTFDDIESGKKGRLRVQEFIYQLLKIQKSNLVNDQNNKSNLKELVFMHLADDLHTPKALAALFKFVNTCNLENMSSNLATQILEDLKSINNIFDVWTFEEKQEQFPNEIIELAEQRFKAKMDKNWSLADELRIKLTESGYQVKDSKDSYVLSKI